VKKIVICSLKLTSSRANLICVTFTPTKRMVVLKRQFHLARFIDDRPHRDINKTAFSSVLAHCPVPTQINRHGCFSDTRVRCRRWGKFDFRLLGVMKKLHFLLISSESINYATLCFEPGLDGFARNRHSINLGLLTRLTP